MQELKDTQSETDTRNISIDRVGVKGLRFPIQIQDKLNRIQSTVATVSLAVDLPEEFKGTHMSRFVEALPARPPAGRAYGPGHSPGTAPPPVRAPLPCGNGVSVLPRQKRPRNRN